MEQLKDKVRTEVESLGYYLYDLKYSKRGKDYVLSVEIDSDDKIGIDDCVKVSERLSKLFDEAEPFEEPYMLEVISAGAEHALRNTEEMKRATGKFVQITTPHGDYRGTLLSVSDEAIEVLDKKQNKTVTISQGDIRKIRLAIEF